MQSPHGGRWTGKKGEAFQSFSNNVKPLLNRQCNEAAKAVNRGASPNLAQFLDLLRAASEPGSSSQQFIDELAAGMVYDQAAVSNGFMPGYYPSKQLWGVMSAFMPGVTTAEIIDRYGNLAAKELPSMQSLAQLETFHPSSQPGSVVYELAMESLSSLHSIREVLSTAGQLPDMHGYPESVASVHSRLFKLGGTYTINSHSATAIPLTVPQVCVDDFGQRLQRYEVLVAKLMCIMRTVFGLVDPADEQEIVRSWRQKPEEDIAAYMGRCMTSHGYIRGRMVQTTAAVMGMVAGMSDTNLRSTLLSHTTDITYREEFISFPKVIAHVSRVRNAQEHLRQDAFSLQVLQGVTLDLGVQQQLVTPALPPGLGAGASTSHAHTSGSRPAIRAQDLCWIHPRGRHTNEDCSEQAHIWQDGQIRKGPRPGKGGTSKVMAVTTSAPAIAPSAESALLAAVQQLTNTLTLQAGNNRGVGRGNGGQRQLAGNRESASCPHCNFPQGHPGGVDTCWVLHPGMARHRRNWRPSDNLTPQQQQAFRAAWEKERPGEHMPGAAAPLAPQPAPAYAPRAPPLGPPVVPYHNAMAVKYMDPAWYAMVQQQQQHYALPAPQVQELPNSQPPYHVNCLTATGVMPVLTRAQEKEAQLPTHAQAQRSMPASFVAPDPRRIAPGGLIREGGGPRFELAEEPLARGPGHPLQPMPPAANGRDVQQDEEVTVTLSLPVRLPAAVVQSALSGAATAPQPTQVYNTALTGVNFNNMTWQDRRAQGVPPPEDQGTRPTLDRVLQTDASSIHLEHAPTGVTARPSDIRLDSGAERCIAMRGALDRDNLPWHAEPMDQLRTASGEVVMALGRTPPINVILNKGTLMERTLPVEFIVMDGEPTIFGYLLSKAFMTTAKIILMYNQDGTEAPLYYQLEGPAGATAGQLGSIVLQTREALTHDAPTNINLLTHCSIASSSSALLQTGGETGHTPSTPLGEGKQRTTATPFFFPRLSRMPAWTLCLLLFCFTGMATAEGTLQEETPNRPNPWPKMVANLAPWTLWLWFFVFKGAEQREPSRQKPPPPLLGRVVHFLLSWAIWQASAIKPLFSVLVICLSFTSAPLLHILAICWRKVKPFFNTKAKWGVPRDGVIMLVFVIMPAVWAWNKEHGPLISAAAYLLHPSWLGAAVAGDCLFSVGGQAVRKHTYGDVIMTGWKWTSKLLYFPLLAVVLLAALVEPWWRPDQVQPAITWTETTTNLRFKRYAKRDRRADEAYHRHHAGRQWRVSNGYPAQRERCGVKQITSALLLLVTLSIFAGGSTVHAMQGLYGGQPPTSGAAPPVPIPPYGTQLYLDQLHHLQVANAHLAQQLATHRPVLAAAATTHDMSQQQKGDAGAATSGTGKESSAGAHTPAKDPGPASDSQGTPFWAPTPDILDMLQPLGGQETPVQAEFVMDQEHGWTWGNHPGATKEATEALKKAVVGCKKVFANSLNDLPGYTGEYGDARIELTTTERIWSAPRKYSPLELQVQDEKCSELLKAGFISKAAPGTRYASAPTMAAKRDADGNWTDKRFCIDLRSINDHIKGHATRPPLPEELFQRLAGCTVFSTLDLKAGFHQIRLDQDSKECTNFWWNGELWQYDRLLFGLKTATSLFQERIDGTLRRFGLTNVAFSYVDDVLIATRTMEEHAIAVKAVLEALHAEGWRVHPGKSVFGARTVQYLGHQITPEGLEPCKVKTAAILQLPAPKDVSELRSVLGLLNFYRCYLPSFSLTAGPMNKLLQKGAAYEWGEEQQSAFDTLRKELAEPGCGLRQPDKNREFFVHTDWSEHGVSGILSQQDDKGNHYLVACTSRSLNQHERNYPAFKGETLACVYAVRQFRPYLHGRKFTLVTDHRPLVYLMKTKEPIGQQQRWILTLMEHDFTILHVDGKLNPADAPSRTPQWHSYDNTGARHHTSQDPFTPSMPTVRLPDGTVLQDLPSQEQLAAELGIPKKVGRGKLKEGHPVNVTVVSAHHGKPVPTCEMGLWISQTKASHHILTTMQHYNQRGISASTIPTGSDILGRDAELLHPDWEANMPELPSWPQHLQQELRQAANSWVHAAVTQPPPVHYPDSQQARINTSSVLPSLASGQGLVVLDLFGGLGAGLEMALRNGMAIHKYYHVDFDPTVRSVARWRVAQLAQRYPDQFPPSAFASMHDTLPHDVYLITKEHLLQAGATQGGQWLMVAGWPCQDLSRAGNQRGLTGNRSSAFYPMVNILQWLQELQPLLLPAYLLENVNFKDGAPAAQQAYVEVTQQLGHPHVLDAAQFNSLAHRLRYFWTNMATPVQLAAALRQVRRQPGLAVQPIMLPMRVCQPVTTTHPASAGYWPANTPGQARSCWPTLMASEQSRAFRPNQGGAVLRQDGTWDEPAAVERERAMGYYTDDTAAPGVSELDRRKILGNAMDMNTLQCIMAAALAWNAFLHKPHLHAATPAHVCTLLAPTHPPLSSTPASHPPAGGGYSALTLRQQQAAGEQQVMNATLIFTAQISEGAKDIWQDGAAMHFLQHGGYPQDTTENEKRRIRKRTASYSWSGGNLLRTMQDGTTRLVPPLADRADIVRKVHGLGHLGVRRTTALVANSYYWQGMLTDITLAVKQCDPCQRAKVSFGKEGPTLHPLPMVGLGFRWHCDLFGPIKHNTTNRYAMVCVESYSRWIEVIPIPDKKANHTAQAFLHAVIARWGAPAEVVTDQGNEFEGEFDQLLRQCHVDHRRTSASHPQSNGAAERMVQTLKRSLQKLIEDNGKPSDWERLLAWAALAYRAAPQEASRMSPYELVFAKKPVIPPAKWEEATRPINLELMEGNVAQLARELHSRQKHFQEMAPMATANKAIAQHRDIGRYAQRRSGKYLPKLYEFKVGELVYCEAAPGESLQSRAPPIILRVLEVKKSGVLKLQGRDGKVKSVHCSHVSPCLLAGIDTTLDADLLHTTGEERCEVCRSPEGEDTMVMCDNCFTGWHMACLNPPLPEVPEGLWICPHCQEAGFTQEGLQYQTAARRAQDGKLAQTRLNFPNATIKRQEMQAEELNGRLCQRLTAGVTDGDPHWSYARLRYMGREQRPRSLLLTSEDGAYERTSLTNLRSLTSTGRLRLLGSKAQLPPGVQIPEAAALHASA